MSNTLWSPRVHREDAPIYRAIADALERDVSSGVLHDGARLPTHRELAAKLHVTPLTITRAYKEAARRGLIDSSVGRGTFVRSTKSPFDLPGRGENTLLDLGKNIVFGSDILDLEPRILNSLRQIVGDAEYQPTEGMLRHRIAAAAWTARNGLEVEPDRIVITPGAQQAIVAILASICRPGDTILAEEWTYPRFGAIAGLLHLHVLPVALDEHGIVPQSLEKAIRRGTPKALYLVPNFQNPTGSVMPEKRRRDIAAIARRHELPMIEDDVYGFLLPSPPAPVASFAPELTSFVTSTSKSISPSLRLGFAAVPESLLERVTSACGALTAFTSSAAAEIFVHLFETGTADRVIERKRSLIATNRRAAERGLGEIQVAAHPMSPHLWIEMPHGLDAHDVADRARLRGIGVAPASAFTADHNRTGGAMRVSIGATDDAKQLESALRLIASLVSHPRLSTATVV
jgi:DNA-binding transcriptional MocR family regulator